MTPSPPPAARRSDALPAPASVLLIEDEDGDAGLILTYLRMAFAGAAEGGSPRLVRVDSLAAGRRAAAAETPEIVLLDLHLPDSDGLASFRDFAADFPEVPVIVLTGLDDDHLSHQAMQAGAQDYLVKGSFDAGSLGRALSHALVRNRLRSELARVRDGLEQAVAARTAELHQRITELEQAQIALKVLLDQRDRDRTETGDRIALNLRQQVAPFLRSLAHTRLDPTQKHLLQAAECNLSTAINDDLRLAGAFRQLTPGEIRVALLIRQGLGTKEIAETLSLSVETIAIHRKHIRAKLGLRHRGSNLRAWLMSLAD